MSNELPASNAVPPLPKIDPLIMRPVTKGSQQVAASSDKAMAHLTRAANEEDLYQWSRQLSSSIPRETLKKARKVVGAGVDSTEFRDFVQAHHISSKPVEVVHDSPAGSDSQGSDYCIQSALPPVDPRPATGATNVVKREKSTGGRAPRKVTEAEASYWWSGMTVEEYEQSLTKVTTEVEEEEHHANREEEDQQDEEEDFENEEDEVVIITGDEDTKSSWTLPTPEKSENSVSSAPSIDSEQAQNAAEEDTSEQVEDSIAEEVSTPTFEQWADQHGLDLDDELADLARSGVNFNGKLLELDSRTGVYHSRIPNEIDFTYTPNGSTTEVAFILNDSGSIANARSFCETSPNAHETLVYPWHNPLLVRVQYHKPSTVFPDWPIGLAFAETSARTLGDLVEIALAMRLGAGKWKAKGFNYEWTEAMVKKAREEGMMHLLGSVVYSRWAQGDPEEDAALDAELFGGMNEDAKQLQEAVKSQEKAVDAEQGEVAKDGAEQTAEEVAAGQSVEAELPETDLEQDAAAQDIASEAKMVMLAGVLGLLLTAYMILYC
ncbi:hypothetical protein CB0940_10944 [Cercospora beticola]|uniref:Uncharacterized protein n=1 Tax=Cercospora beticola TaxID=122368 RepID=A0A2G5HE05_CERBT|nr:hypothetical protein CB0940_10944 [Cercospora beticola]PIA90784.1 hypothetical protein CB0940_10944 [Cercospora beticola]WPB07710.1 hypothetical protein RHO25_012372 [Cercospora beticola]